MLLWPPILATWGPGGASRQHAHHALHLVLCLEGSLRVSTPEGGEVTAVGVLTAPDAAHAIDARGAEVLLLFIEPESEPGGRLRAALDGPLRLFESSERDQMLASLDRPLHPSGVARWVEGAFASLGSASTEPRPMHPRIQRVLRELRKRPPGEAALTTLAAVANLSPSRLMHAFTASVGIPLRPYLLWLKLQRAATAIVLGRPLAHAAAEAGFSDAAHMTRTFRSMLGLTPSELRGRSQLIQDPALG